jgi:hypothetical protein
MTTARRIQRCYQSVIQSAVTMCWVVVAVDNEDVSKGDCSVRRSKVVQARSSKRSVLPQLSTSWKLTTRDPAFSNRRRPLVSAFCVCRSSSDAFWRLLSTIPCKSRAASTMQRLLMADGGVTKRSNWSRFKILDALQSLVLLFLR